MKRLAPLFIAVAVFASLPAAAQVLPAPPHSATDSDGSDGPGWVRVKSSMQGGIGGFVDVPGYQSCRYVTSSADQNAGDLGEGIPMQSLSNWQNWLTESAGIGDTAVVCCRPSTPALNSALMCNDGGTATAVTAINGTGTSGYGQLGSTGTATATCLNPPYGTYTTEVPYTCKTTGNGVTADGSWVQSGADSNSCATSTPDTTFGACSASCGGGHEYETVYDACGKVTSQGNFGPSCNTQACCTPVYSYSCNQSNGNYVQTDTTCGTGSTVIGACSYNITTSTKSCGGFNYSDSYPDGACTISYKQCNDSDWGCGVDATCNEGCSTDGCGQSFATHETCGGVTKNGGSTCPVYQYECSRGRYTYP